MSMNLMLISMMLSVIISMAFFFIGKKFNWEKTNASTFECGFTSYFFSRFSFSIHYFMVGMIFLFLDLELCFLMPYLNEIQSDMKMFLLTTMFVLILLIGLLLEWKEKKLEWKF